MAKRRRRQTPPAVSTPDHSATIQFIIGLCLGLVPWGLSLMGVTLNFWFGAIITTASFFLLAHAFWLWEKAARWRKSLRVSTLVLAAILYFGFITALLATRQQEQPPSQQQTTVAPTPLTSPTPQPTLAVTTPVPTPTQSPTPSPSPSAAKSRSKRSNAEAERRRQQKLLEDLGYPNP